MREETVKLVEKKSGRRRDGVVIQSGRVGN
jgi:hypothetical protein